MHESRQQTKRL